MIRRPTHAIMRSAQQLRCWVSSVLRTPAPAHCERWAPIEIVDW